MGNIYRMILEGRCDRARYPLSHLRGPILRVAYRDWNVPFRRNGKPIDYTLWEAPATKSYLYVAKTDSVPQTEEAAYWFARACYEHFKRAVWYFYPPTHTLIVVPPPPNDGDLLIVEVEEQLTPNAKPTESLDAPPNS